MNIDEIRREARALSYQWREPCWVVLDLFERGLRLFVGPHVEYLESEPQRYLPFEIHHPDGEREPVVGWERQ